MSENGITCEICEDKKELSGTKLTCKFWDHQDCPRDNHIIPRDNFPYHCDCTKYVGTKASDNTLDCIPTSNTGNCKNVDNSNECSECAYGYYLDNVKSCIPYLTHCAYQTEASICLECIDGYSIGTDKSCFKNDVGCVGMDDADNCNSCVKGFSQFTNVAQNKKCTQNYPHCDQMLSPYEC